MTTAECRRKPWGLLVALDGEQNAEGELYLDDGESLEPAAVTWVHVRAPFLLPGWILADMFQFSATKQSIRASPEGNYVDTNAFANATVMGLARGPVRIWVNQHTLPLENWEYNLDTEVLSLHGLNSWFPHGAWATGWEINWE